MKTLSVIILIFIASQLKAQTIVADVNGGYLLGAYKDSVYVVDTLAATWLKGGEKYQVYDLRGSLGQVTGSTSENMPPCFDTYYLSFDTLFENADGCAIALSSAHDAFPKVLDHLHPGNENASAIVLQWLSDSGITKPVASVNQIIRTDLENDGQDEMLISATLYTDEFLSSADAGNYSVVLMEKIVDGKHIIIPVIYELYIERTEAIAPMTYSIGGILDIDGDGKYEIILQWQYYEGAGVIIIRMKGNEPEFIMGSGCGV